VEADEFTLQIRGRIDGLLSTSQECCGIKTCRERLDHLADLGIGAGQVLRFIYARSQALDNLVIQTDALELATAR